MIGWATLALLAAMVAGSRFVPTADEMQASFDHAQKFYSSGAYDQAIENYQHIVQSRSRFLHLDEIKVTAGEITAPLQEVAPYQIGNAYFRMGEEALQQATRARSEEEQSRHLTEVRTQFERAAEFFAKTESMSSIPVLQALARSRAVACWYRIKEYERTIGEAKILIERYPESKYVVQAMYDIGWAYHDMGDYLHSIEAFKALFERFPSGYRANRALFQIGESYFELERYSEAVPHYQRLVDSQRIGQMSEREILQMKRDKIAGLVDETSLDLAAKALIRIGECYEKVEEYDKAGKAFEVVATQFADEPRLVEEAYLRHADMHYNRGDFAATIAVYRRAIAAERDAFGKARIQLLLANRYFETEHFQDAVREYDYYRDTYATRAAQAGLPVEGVGLQIARAWLGEADKRSANRRLDAYRRAEADLRHTLTAYPGSNYEIELRFNLGLALQLQGDAEKMEEALLHFNRVIDASDPGGYRQSALFQSARIHQSSRRYGEAAAVYRQLIAELGDKPVADIARFELGIAELDRGAWQTAVEEFLNVRPEASLFARSRLEAGQLLVSHDENRRAIEVLGDGVEAETEPASLALLHYLIGATHARLGDYQTALPHYDRAVTDVSAEFVERAVYARGVALFKLGRHDEAISDFDRTWSDAELSVFVPRLLASAYTSVGQPDKALQVYQKLALTAVAALERGEYMLALAEIAYRQGRYAETVETCRDLVQLVIDETILPEGRPYYLREKAFFLRADASIRLGDFRGAAAAAAGGLEAYGDGYYAADFLFIGGLAALNLERHEEAVARLTQMLERFPTHANAGYAYYYLGYAYFNQRFFARTIPYFDRVVEQFADLDVVPDALFRRADCRFNLGRFEQAQQDYQRVTDRYPAHSLAEDALYNIAWCLMSLAPAATAGEQSAELQQAFAAYLERYPLGRHVATVRYTLAEMNFNAEEYQRAYDLFRRIEREFPGSPAAEKATGVLPELREALSYQAYSATMEIFNRAVAEDDKALFRQAIPTFEEVWRQYSDTSSGIAAKVNIGVCYQRLKDWKKAVETFDEIIAEGEKGHPQVTANVVEFVERRRGTIARKHL